MAGPMDSKKMIDIGRQFIYLMIHGICGFVWGGGGNELTNELGFFIPKSTYNN